MTKNDIINLENILKDKKQIKDARQQIRKIFHHKKCSIIVHESKDLMTQLSKKEDKVVILVVVMSLLYENIDSMSEVIVALEKENLISQLYGALRILFCGKSSMMRLNIEWTDSQFSNKLDFIDRFIGQFGYWENHEILFMTQIIAKVDRKRFEDLVFNDPTYLILLNMVSYQLNEKPTQELIKRLLKDGDELQANAGFYFIIEDIRQLLYNYHGLKKERDLLEKYLEIFCEFYSVCTKERQISLLMNYILIGDKYPSLFGDLLMRKELQENLIKEIISSDKIRRLDHLAKVINIIHGFSCKDEDGNCYKKDKLYDAILVKIKHFILNGHNIGRWDNRTEKLFQMICKKLPKKQLRKLNTFLKSHIKTYMVSELDEMVRYSIFLQDEIQYNICQGIMNVIKTFKI